MRFEQLAKKAYERHDVLRALVLLVEGLKRHVDEDSYALLIEVYACGCKSPGMEEDVLNIILRHPNAHKVLCSVVQTWNERDLPDMVRALKLQAQRKGLVLEEILAQQHQEEEEEEECLNDTQGEDVQDAQEFGTRLDDTGLDVEGGAQKSNAAALVSLERVLAAQDMRRPEEGEDVEQNVRRVRTSLAMPQPERKRRVVSFVVLALLILGGAVGGYTLARSTSARALDAQLEMFDSLNPGAFEQAIWRATKRWGQSGAAFMERSRFIAGLIALDRGTTFTPQESGEPTSAWGYGARVWDALHAQDYERALRSVLVLERIDPDALATWWVRARFEEERGHFKAAYVAYSEALRRFSRFVPGLMGQMRVAFCTANESGLTQIAARLQKISPSHPYVALAQLEPLRSRDITRLNVRGNIVRTPSLKLTRGDNFMHAFEAYHRAVRAWHRGDVAATRKETNRALHLESRLGPALLLRSILLAAEYKHDASVASFDRLASMDGVSVELRLDLMQLAMRSLTESGRPELGLRFAPNLGGDLAPSKVFQAQEAWLHVFMERPVALSLSKKQAKLHPRRYAHVAFEFARTLRAVGWSMTSLKVLDEMERLGMSHVEAPLLRALCLYQSGRNARFDDVLQSLNVHVQIEARLVKALKELWRGSKAESERLTVATRAQLGHRPEWLVLHAYALLGNGRAGQLRTALARMRMSPTYMPLGDRLKLRIWSKLRPGNKVFASLYKQLASMHPTSIDLVLDLAVASFWQGHLKDAKKWAEEALKSSSKHPEAHWVMGLVYRHEGKLKRAREHFMRAHVDAEHDPRLLVDLGHVYLDTNREKEASKVFYKALLRDRRNLDAIRGMGRAFLGSDQELGKRELRRIFEHWYEGKESLRGQGGEMLKWLAVLYGSRSGHTLGFSFLQRSHKALGQRTDVLIEFARYYEALGQHVESKNMYVEALRHDTTSSQAHLGLSRAALRDKDRDRAKDHLRTYLELDPYGAHAAWAKRRMTALGAK